MMSQEDRGFDCSGLVLFAFSEAGIDLPRSSGEQIRAAAEIQQSEAEPGDLVYYPGHISLYLGADLMVHSPQSGKDVEVRPLFDRSLRFGDAIESQA
jgi:cell wall-associated NlpC family hydrolase